MADATPHACGTITNNSGLITRWKPQDRIPSASGDALGVLFGSAEMAKLKAATAQTEPMDVYAATEKLEAFFKSAAGEIAKCRSQKSGQKLLRQCADETLAFSSCCASQELHSHFSFPFPLLGNALDHCKKVIFWIDEHQSNNVANVLQHSATALGEAGNALSLDVWETQKIDVLNFHAPKKKTLPGPVHRNLTSGIEKVVEASKTLGEQLQKVAAGQPIAMPIKPEGGDIPTLSRYPKATLWAVQNAQSANGNRRVSQAEITAAADDQLNADKRVGQRTIKRWLPTLEKKKFVDRDGSHNGYAMTSRGRACLKKSD